MTGKQQETLDRLFAEAVALPLERQPAFLRENCRDPEVRLELESLLAFASRPLAGFTEAIQRVAGSLAAPDFAGLRLGEYRLTGRIGQGGMGAVYRAVRDDDQFQKTVAVKMLRFPDGDPAMLARFRQERQILASLEHPHIARLLDGGAAPLPYIVMEYVDGLPVTSYCEQEKLTVAGRLGLFRKVCDAVSYAHRQLVVHRDIKPGNILVTADGSPKLLDFGVSKLLTPVGMDPATITSTACAAMTPDYASPEQVRGEPVSTLTDVYSLGTVLYELLTGRRPHQLGTRDPFEIAREICEHEVESPRVNAEIDLVVLKAMHREPARRYQSVEQFSEDIRRYLEGRPIVARPDTLAYRGAKFVRRHRLGVGAAATLFAALVGGISVSTWEARRADTEAAAARAVNEFLQSDLLAQAGASAQSGPDTKPDPDLKVRTALDRAAGHVGAKFAKQPLVEASIRQTLGDAYEDLGLYPEAQQHMERALELRRRARGEADRDTLKSMHNLARLLFLEGKYAQAEAPLRSTLAAERRLLGAEHSETLDTMTDLAGVYRALGRYAEAEPLYRKVLDIQPRVLGEKHLDTATTMNELGMLYRLEGQYARAEPLYIRSLDIMRQLKGDEHPDTLTIMNNLAVLYDYEDKYEQAEPLFSKVLEVRRRVLGEEHHFTLLSMYNLASLYGDVGKYKEAEALLVPSEEVRRRVLGEEHSDTLDGTLNLALLYRSEGRYAQAETLFARLLELERRVRGREHRDTLNVMYALAELYRRQARNEEAERLSGAALEVQRRVLGAQHRATLATLALLGRVRVERQKYAEAEPTLREALTGFEQGAADDWRRHLAETLLGASLAGQTRYAEAESLLLAGYRGLLQRQAAIPADTKSVVGQAGERIVRVYIDWGKPEQASEWRQKLAGGTPRTPR